MSILYYRESRARHSLLRLNWYNVNVYIAMPVLRVYFVSLTVDCHYPSDSLEKRLRRRRPLQ